MKFNSPEEAVEHYAESYKKHKKDWASAQHSFHLSKFSEVYEKLKLAIEAKHLPKPEFIKQNILGSYRVVFRDISYDLAEKIPTMCYSSYDYEDKCKEVTFSFSQEEEYREELKNFSKEVIEDLTNLPDRLERLHQKVEVAYREGKEYRRKLLARHLR